MTRMFPEETETTPNFLLAGHVDDGLDERFIRNETIFIFLGAGLLENWDNFLLLQSLAKGDKDMLELSVQHGAVIFLVVKLEDLNEVLV